MKDHEDNDSFINHLLEETYQSLPGEDSGRESDDLYSYFKMKRQESLKKNPLSFFKENDVPYFSLDYQPKISCYRMQLAGFELDIPNNWSFCKELHQKVLAGSTAYLPLWNNEYAHFAESLEAFFSAHPDTLQAFIVHGGCIQLVLVSKNDSELIEYLESFDSTYEESFSKAA